jgi:hypothetical protein
MPNFTFIGGPFDGKVRMVPDGQAMIRLPTPSRTLTTHPFEPSATLEFSIYRIMHLGTREEFVSFYVLYDLQLSEILQRLLAWYKPPDPEI